MNKENTQEDLMHEYVTHSLMPIRSHSSWIASNTFECRKCSCWGWGHDIFMVCVEVGIIDGGR